MTSQHGGYDDREYVAEYYDAAYNRRNDKDVAFYVNFAKGSGGRTLELGCGTGRVLIPTAAAGCEITGLDLSAYMLQVCREKLAEQPEDLRRRVKLIRADMTDFNTGEKYALATLPFRPFQHLITVKEQKACLECLHRHLTPKGCVVLDVFNPNPLRLMPNTKYMEENEDLPETALPDGRKLRRTSRMAGYHRAEQYNDVELIYYVTHADGRTERLVQSFPMRYYYRYEMEHLLELCRFKVADLFGDFDGSAFSSDSPEIIFIAEKK